MKKLLYKTDIMHLNEVDSLLQCASIQALEQGQVVYLPRMSFSLRTDESVLLNPRILSKGHKNVSYDVKTQKLGGIDDAQWHAKAAFLMARYAHYARELIEQLFPAYTQALQWGRTSYRPAEIDGRASSQRKDDTRIHVDAFPSTPVHGQRILRVFCNINPEGHPRVWHLGETFSEVLQRFSPRIPPYRAFKAYILKWIKATKTLRTAYDHYMLHLHDTMKLDDHYQTQLEKYRFDFPAQTTWVVYTDQVSHAALKGQFLLEQTFYLPIEAMNSPSLSPLKQWENCLSSCKIGALIPS